MDTTEIRTGTVMDITDGLALVRLTMDDADCGGCRSCAMRSLCQGKDYGKMDLRLPLPSGLAGAVTPGAEVRVRYRPAHAGLAGAALFLPALAGLGLGGWAGLRLGAGADAALLAGCGIGLAAGVALTWIINRTVPSLHPRAAIEALA